MAFSELTEIHKVKTFFKKKLPKVIFETANIINEYMCCSCYYMKMHETVQFIKNNTMLETRKSEAWCQQV